MDSFLQACRMLTILPAPVRSPREPGAVLPWFPAVGLVNGAALAGFAWLLGRLLPLPTAVVLGALALPVLHQWVMRWRGARGVVSLVEQSIMASAGDSVEAMRGALYRTVLVVQLLAICKVALMGLVLLQGRLSWFVLVPTVSVAVFGECLYVEQETRPVPDLTRVRLFWAVPLAVALCLGLVQQQIGPLVVLGVVWLLLRGAQEWLPARLPGAESRGAVRMELTEILLYFAATLT